MLSLKLIIDTKIPVESTWKLIVTHQHNSDLKIGIFIVKLMPDDGICMLS